jgi:ferritin-like metal-binding protein YciE
MSEENAGEQKLVQYLGEAYGKEKELETALQAHIEMTDRAPYRKRLNQHLKETRNHARLVERRMKKLGGGGHLLQDVAARGMAMAKAPLHAMRGKSDEEKLLKNAKTEYSEEAEEIATYTSIEALAETLGDRETAKVARQIRREEERMAAFLARQIPILTRAALRAEAPGAANGGRSRASGGRKRSTAARRARSTARGSSSSRSRSRSRKSSSRRRSTTRS